MTFLFGWLVRLWCLKNLSVFLHIYIFDMWGKCLGKRSKLIHLTDQCFDTWGTCLEKRRRVNWFIWLTSVLIPEGNAWRKKEVNWFIWSVFWYLREMLGKKEINWFIWLTSVCQNSYSLILPTALNVYVTLLYVGCTNTMDTKWKTNSVKLCQLLRAT